MRRIVFGMLYLMVFTIAWEEMIFFGAAGSLGRWLGYGAILLAVGAVIAKGGLRPPAAMLYAIGLFLVWACASMFWTVDTNDTAFRLLVYLRLAGMAWLVWEFADTMPRQLLIMQAYLFGAYVSLLGQFASFVYSGTRAIRFGGGGLDVNQFAVVLSLGFVVAVYAATHPLTKHRLLRFLYWAYCPLAGFGVLLTGSRTGMIALACGIAISVMLYARRSVLASIVIVGVAAAALGAFIRWAPEGTVQRMTGIYGELTEGTWTARTEIYHRGMALAADNPVVGTGAGTFRTVIGTIRMPGGYIRHNIAPHISYLGILVETGAVGLVLYCMIGVVGFLYAVKLPRRERTLWVAIILTWAITAVGLDLSAHKMTWFFFGLLAVQHETLRGMTAWRPFQAVNPTRVLQRAS